MFKISPLSFHRHELRRRHGHHCPIAAAMSVVQLCPPFRSAIPNLAAICASIPRYPHIHTLTLTLTLSLTHAEIISEQNAAKIVKLSQPMPKLCRKLKWLLFMRHDVEYNCHVKHCCRCCSLTRRCVKCK